jgi:IS5 family transposase
VIEPNDPKAGQVREKHAPPALPHGPEQRLHGDSAPASQQELIRSKAPKAADFTK